jgi:hypothetical protein
MVFASRRSVELDQQLGGQESLLDKRQDREALLRRIAVGVVEDENGSARHAVQRDLTAHTGRPDVPAVGYRFGRADLTESAIGLATEGWRGGRQQRDRIATLAIARECPVENRGVTEAGPPLSTGRGPEIRQSQGRACLGPAYA